MFASFLLRPVPARAALPLAAAIGLAYAIALFGPAILLGHGEFWTLPRGPAGLSIDYRISLSGYWWIVQDAWRWPILALPRPDDTNGALFDPVPLLALLAKTWRTLTGHAPNLFPAWTAATFALNAAAFAALVRAMGQRSLLAAITAAGLGALAPVVHHRFGHPALGGHWVFLAAMAIHAAWSAPRRAAGPATPIGTLLLLCVLAFASSLYLYVMTAAVAGAAILQAGFDRRLGVAATAAGLLGVALAGLGPLWAFGMLGDAHLAGGSKVPFGEMSMNLLAPFWPQNSGAFGWTGLYLLTRGSIGATAGQSDAYCYLGLGVLLLLAVAAARAGWRMAGVVRRHWVVALALLLLAVWAVSNRVYVGDRLLAAYALPDVLLSTVLAWFRGSGRFFWPVAWTIAALGVAGALGSLRPAAAIAVAALALALQWIDLAPWRAELRAAVEPPVSAFGPDAAALEARIATMGRVALAPSPRCADTRTEYRAPAMQAAIEVQLMAARANARMTAPAMARNAADCDAERALPLPEMAGDGLLIALRQPRRSDRTAEALRTLDCTPVAPGLVCTRRPDAAK